MDKRNLEYKITLLDRFSGVYSKFLSSTDRLQGKISKLGKIQGVFDKLTQSTSTFQPSIDLLSERLEVLTRKRNSAFNEKDIVRYNSEIRRTQSELKRLENLPKQSFFDKIKKLGSNGLLPLIGIAAVTRGLGNILGVAAQNYNIQASAVTRLRQVMFNTMGAREMEVNSILRLTSVQQKLGVVGDEIQISGAQELSTYLSKSKHLKTLIPVMNNMLAQQYGYNATQEQAVTIAQMMGKVLDGQVGSLSRYGYRFDEAQEKIFKFGTEAQKVAMLTEVITKYVGGVNEALAQTPEGKLKQASNNYGDLLERVGKLYIAFKERLMPIQEAFIGGINNLLDNLIGGYRRLKQSIEVIQPIAESLSMVLKSMSPIIIGLVVYSNAAAMGFALWTIKYYAFIVATKIATAVTWLFNAALWANPMTWIVALIAGLVVALTILYLRVEKVRAVIWALWDTINEIGSIISDFFSGLWDLVTKGDNTRIKSALNAGERIGAAWKKGMQAGSKDFHSPKFSADDSIMDYQTDSKARPASDDVFDISSNITGGGSRPTNITINLGKLQDSIVIHSSTVKEGVDEMEEIVVDALLRVLNSANAVATGGAQ